MKIPGEISLQHHPRWSKHENCLQFLSESGLRNLNKDFRIGAFISSTTCFVKYTDTLNYLHSSFVFECLYSREVHNPYPNKCSINAVLFQSLQSLILHPTSPVQQFCQQYKVFTVFYIICKLPVPSNAGCVARKEHLHIPESSIHNHEGILTTDLLRTTCLIIRNKQGHFCKSLTV